MRAAPSPLTISLCAGVRSTPTRSAPTRRGARRAHFIVAAHRHAISSIRRLHGSDRNLHASNCLPARRVNSPPAGWSFCTEDARSPSPRQRHAGITAALRAGSP